MKTVTCCNGLCSVKIKGSHGVAAHKCQHGKLCRYQQDERGTVLSWGRSMCEQCNVALEAAA